MLRFTAKYANIFIWKYILVNMQKSMYGDNAKEKLRRATDATANTAQHTTKLRNAEMIVGES